MSRKLIHSITNKFVAAVIAIAMIGIYVPAMASATPLTTRSVTIGSSAPSAVTTYNFAFTAPSATVVKSVSLTACTTASGACTTPSGFVNSATFTQPTGLGSTSGWTSSTATAGSLRILNASSVGAPGAATLNFSGVTNPSTANATFFLRITTYSDSAWTTPIDTGNVAAATAGQITVTASIDETLTFTLSATTVALGTLTTATTGKDGTTSMVASTNGNTGYTITYSGNSLTGPRALASYSSSASVAGTEGFGFNLTSNTTPAVGTAISGSGTGTVSAGYGTTNAF